MSFFLQHFRTSKKYLELECENLIPNSRRITLGRSALKLTEEVIILVMLLFNHILWGFFIKDFN